MRSASPMPRPSPTGVCASGWSGVLSADSMILKPKPSSPRCSTGQPRPAEQRLRAKRKAEDAARHRRIAPKRWSWRSGEWSPANKQSCSATASRSHGSELPAGTQCGGPQQAASRARLRPHLVHSRSSRAWRTSRISNSVPARASRTRQCSSTDPGNSCVAEGFPTHREPE